MAERPDPSYVLLRVTLGINIFMHGIVRWVAGLRGFASAFVPMFQRTPLPTWSMYGFGYVLPILEAAIGAAVFVGFRTRAALTSGATLMIVLTFGSALWLAPSFINDHLCGGLH